MYPGLSHDEIIEECLKELKHHFEVGPEVALISAEKGVQCVPFDESLQKKFPYFEGTYEVFDVPHAHRAGCRMGACDRQPQCRKIHSVLCRRVPFALEGRADCCLFRGDLEAFP